MSEDEHISSAAGGGHVPTEGGDLSPLPERVPAGSPKRSYTRNGWKRSGILVPMILAMLFLIGFLFYWLRDNYRRESESLATRSQLLFREMVRETQDSMLSKSLWRAVKDSGGPVFRTRPLKADKGKTVFRVRQRPGGSDSAMPGRPASIDTAYIVYSSGKADTAAGPVMLQTLMDSVDPNLIRSIQVMKNTRPAMLRGTPGTIRMDSVPGAGEELSVRGYGTATPDDAERLAGKPRQYRSTVQFSTITINSQDGARIVLEMDSLAEKRIPDSVLVKNFRLVQQREGIEVPFSITPDTNRDETTRHRGRRQDDDAPRGHYRLDLGSTFSYVIGEIRGSIFFSLFLFLLCLTAFVILYRSLLKQYRLTAMKNELISNITHELKTPIATVGVAIEALKNFNALNDTRKTHEYLDISGLEIQRLGLLVDKVLKLSMFESDRILLNLESVELGSLIREVTESLRLQLEKQAATISIDTEPNLVLDADRLHLLSVVYNLLDNALKYSDRGAQIAMKAAHAGDLIRFSVTDNGIGIPRAYQAKVFDKFFRVPSGNLHNSKGHGLGLSYVARVVELHGGSIALQSREGEGSTFTIEFPTTKLSNTDA